MIEAASEVRAFENDNKEVLARLQTRQTQFDQLTATKNTMREAIKEEQKAVQAMISESTREEKEIVHSYTELQSVAELDDEIQAVNARLEMMSAGDGSVVRTYENREAQIRKTQDSLEKHIAALEEAQQKIADIKGPFESGLDELVAKISAAFSHNFAQIGCAGEVMVYKDNDDFNAWSIQIMVRFR